VLMDTDPESLAVLPKILLVQQFYYAFMHFIIKLCILAFYLRLSPQRSFRLAVYGTIVLNTACTLAIWLLFCFQCIPMKAFWSPMREAKCLPPVLLWFLPASLVGAPLELLIPGPHRWMAVADIEGAEHRNGRRHPHPAVTDTVQAPDQSSAAGGGDIDNERRRRLPDRVLSPAHRVVPPSLLSHLPPRHPHPR